VHLVVEALAFARQLALHSQGRELVRYNAKRPAALVRCAPVSKSKDFRWGLVLVSITEWTVYRADALYFTPGEVGGPFRAIRRNDHPTTGDRVFTQFGQPESSTGMRETTIISPPRSDDRRRANGEHI